MTKKEIKDMYEPLVEWLEGNPKIDNSMQKELLDIVRDMIMQTIDGCYEKYKETLRGKTGRK